MINKRYKLQARGLSKKFNRTILFEDIHLAGEPGDSLCVTGPNGSGKSTLLKILAGLQNPTKGDITYSADTDISRDEWMDHIGYTGPLINPYEDLTALENIHFALKQGNGAATADSLLRKFDLYRHRDKKIKYYSSGMKQRLKIIMAVLNDPPVLILDEPGTNLDATGRDILYTYLDTVRNDKIIILATNEPGEEKLCGEVIRLGQ
jgi:ABC-type multidrug transport system ATPase subunit